MMVKCTGCGGMIAMPDLQAPKILNTPVASIAVFEHKEQGFCHVCSVPVALQVQQITHVGLIAAPVPAPEQNKIVLANGVH